MLKTLVFKDTIVQISEEFPVHDSFSWIDNLPEHAVGQVLIKGEWVDPTPEKTPEEKALSEIARLEGEVTPRRMREAVLGTDGGWLENQESLIAAERAKL